MFFFIADVYREFLTLRAADGGPTDDASVGRWVRHGRLDIPYRRPHNNRGTPYQRRNNNNNNNNKNNNNNNNNQKNWNTYIYLALIYFSLKNPYLL